VLTGRLKLSIFSLNKYLNRDGNLPVKKDITNSEFDLSKSSFYQKLKHESDEIHKVKSSESKKCGKEIDYNHALIDWIFKRRTSRSQKIKKQ